MPSLFRARVEQIFDAFTAPRGNDPDVITDRTELIDAIVALHVEDIKEIIADVYRDRAS
jgi:hypothetical protein